MTALEYIYEELNAGRCFGKFFKNVKYPYIDCNLCLSPDKKYIRWQHYGSSANRNTLKDLAWIIENIFDTTPEKFLETYVDTSSYFYSRYESTNTETS